MWNFGAKIDIIRDMKKVISELWKRYIGTLKTLHPNFANVILELWWRFIWSFKRYIRTMKTLYPNLETLHPNFQNVTCEHWKRYMRTQKHYIRTSIHVDISTVPKNPKGDPLDSKSGLWLQKTSKRGPFGNIWKFSKKSLKEPKIL